MLANSSSGMLSHSATMLTLAAKRFAAVREHVGASEDMPLTCLALVARNR